MTNDPQHQPPPRSGHETLHAPWRDAYMNMLADQAKAPNNPHRSQTASSRTPADIEEGGTGGGNGGGNGGRHREGCFITDYWLHPEADQSNHVIARTGTPSTRTGGLIFLNRYPYANGHLLVALGDPRPRLLDYSETQRAELWSLVDLAVELAEKTLECQGVNVGLNQGEAAGAGVPEHLHAHVVPRWGGDVNFMSTVANTRVIPSALERMAERYRKTWQRITAGTQPNP